MATITSAATGNWSAGATWVGGVAPTSVDDVVIAAGHVVTLDVNATIITLTGAAATTNWVEIATSRTLTCTGANGITAKSTASSGALVRITGVGITVNVNSNIRNVNNVSGTGTFALQVSTICTVNIVGNIIVGDSNNTASISLDINNATVNITGNVSGGGIAIRVNSNAVLNITGNVTSGVAGTLAAITNTTSACTINVTGNCTAQIVSAISSTQSSTITVVGTITASNSAVGINMSSGNITISTPCINSANGVMAVNAVTAKIYSTSVASWLFKDELNNNKYLYSAGVALGNPAEADVRNGTTYGASSELTGSLIMAIPANVRRGVNTDATVGTADLTAQDIFTEIANSSDPIAVRLRNIATVQTTGAQLASYN
jgi:hypothetical protein